MAIAVKHHLTVQKVLHEFCNEYLLIAKLQLDRDHHLFLVALYAPPENGTKIRATILQRFKDAIDFLKSRYADPSILVFSDFNKDLRARKHQPAEGLTPIYDTDRPTAFTRSQKKGDKILTSYLD